MKPGTYPIEQIAAAVLAGGKGRRMGGEDKGLVELAGRPMVAHVIDRLRSQAGTLLINANRNRERYAEITGCQVVADREDGYAGPLAGMASAMEAAGARFLLTAPCDAPLVPEHLGPRLYETLVDERAQLSVAHDGARLQPVFALIDSVLLESLLAYLRSGERKIDRWYAQHRMAAADFSDVPQSFSNINTPEERLALEGALGADRARPSPRTRPAGSGIRASSSGES